MTLSPKRLLPHAPLPPYSYVTAHFPHPTREPAGHSFGHQAEITNWQGSTFWSECTAYLRGLDLFNFGYYWEAHEAWEAVWHAAGRRGAAADFLKGLIKLAAAGVKVREGRPQGAVRLARRAEELFRQIPRSTTGEDRFMGLSLSNLIHAARQIAEDPPRLPVRNPLPSVERVFDFCLLPQ